MQEAAFSANFHAFTGEGLPMQVTIRGASFDDFQGNLEKFFAKYEQLGTVNLLLREQPVDSIRAITVRIVGWLRGDTENKYSSNGSTNPCVYLYSNIPHLEFSAATVYAEKLDRLPSSVDWRNAPSVGNMAPPVRIAKNKMHKCDFQVVLMPQFGVDGKPILNKNGKQSYKFDHCIVDGETINHEPASKPVAPDNEHQNLMQYAQASTNPRVKVSPNVQQLCRRLKELDKSSNRPMSVTRMENGEKRTGRYDFLCGIIDRMAGQEMHNEVLSFLIGRPVTKNENDLPGDDLGSFLTEIYKGTDNKPNSLFQKDVYDVVMEAIATCKALSIVPDDVFA